MTKSIAKRLSQYANVQLSTSLNHLSQNEKQALKYLYEAAVPLHTLYRRQVWRNNEETLNLLKQHVSQHPKDQAYIQFYELNAGPWDRLDSESLFLSDELQAITNCPLHPPLGAGFYPIDMNVDEFNAFSLNHPEAKGFYTVIERVDGHLVVKKYSEVYADILESCSDNLKKAASLLKGSLAAFLNARADALISNEYQESDKLWVDVDWKENNIEVTFGPFEVYTDKLLNQKAAYEAFINIIDHVASKKLEEYSSFMQELEDCLPIDGSYKNPKVGAAPPIVVVDQIYSSGDVAGPKTAAYNLPNDEQVIKEKGAKMIILKNVQEAKFKAILEPISKVVLDASQLNQVKFDSFFTHILLHEMSHSLGMLNFIYLTQGIEKNRNKTTVRESLGELHSAIEEAKADITGLWAAFYLIQNNGVLLLDEQKESIYVTYLVSAFRSIRFGLHEAHGLGQAIQLNYLLDQGGFIYDPKSKKFSVNMSSIESGISGLVEKIMTIQGQGDKKAAQSLIDSLGLIRPIVQEALDSIEKNEIPIDILPNYSL